MGRKSLGSLKASKTEHIASGGVGNWTPQSMAFKSASKIFIICQKDGSLGIQNVNMDGKTSHKTTNYRIPSGHGNGGCYCSKDGLVYVSSYSGSANKVVNSWNPAKNWSHVQTISLPVNCTGLGYDPVTDNFYVNSSSGWATFSYDEFTKKSGSKKHKSHNHKHSKVGYWQDAGGYGGVCFLCTSHQNSSSTSYIDCYRAADGKYLGSLTTKGEIESVAVGSDGHFYVLYAQNRRVVKCSNTFKDTFKKVQGIGTSGTVPTVTQKVYDGHRIVTEAKKHINEGGKKFCKQYGISFTDWCAVFVWCMFDDCGITNLITKTAGVAPFDDWLSKNAKTIYKAGTSKNDLTKCKEGDLIICGTAGYRKHICICIQGLKGSCKSIGGNQHGPSPNGRYDINEVTEGTRSDIYAVYRPAYGYHAGNGEDYGEEGGGSGRLEVHPEVLFSSDNFDYLDLELPTESQQSVEQRQKVQSLLDNSTFATAPADSIAVPVLTSSFSEKVKRPKTKLNGAAEGKTLPVGLNPVEAPFVELTIGGYTFGVKSAGEDYPNYIEGLKVKKTNASMNEYSINLVHQISPGRNPNFIDNLLSKNSYNKVKIKYGDANTEQVFVDENALLTGATMNFDVSGCKINYTVNATSSALLAVTNKQTYSATVDKGSNVIFGMLNSNKSALASIYPKMANRSYVASNNLIPTDDAVVNLKGMVNVNDINYLSAVVGQMKSATDPSASYYLLFRDDDFKIYRLSGNNMATDASVYEVDINYPDDNQVFSFNTNVDFAWSLAYEFNGGVDTFNYAIDGVGNVQQYSSPFKQSYSSSQKTTNNWWKQVTEFPAIATLTCRGLLSPLLLMTYVKVNCWYYGSQRLTSGVYVVTGQEDSLSGSGYRTTLSLTKVAGPEEHISIDARIKS